MGAASFAVLSLMDTDKDKNHYTPAASTWMLKEFESKQHNSGPAMGSHKYLDEHPESAERLQKKLHPGQHQQQQQQKME